MSALDRAAAEEMDRVDPLGQFRRRFVSGPDLPIYLDGNSLGRPSVDSEQAIAEALAEWREQLVGGWERWVDLPASVGDRLGRLVGAAAGQILVCDSTTVNLFKLASAALPRARSGGVPAIVADANDFPTDRYVLQGLAEAGGLHLDLVDTDQSDATVAADQVLDRVGPGTALVCLSHVNYRSGLRFDGASVTRRVQEKGALMLWDLAHSAGAVPVDLDGWGADLAVGCSYKYLNGGPGAPGWLYVAARHQDRLRQPVWGWFGQADQFAMGAGYRPAPGVASFMTGTPGILALRAVDAALGVVEEAGIAALWAKSQQLTSSMTDLVTEMLEPLGARLATPRDPDHRGAHISVSHPEAWPLCRALIDRRLVVGDFRTPDVVRLGPAPLYTRHVDCYDAIAHMASTLAGGSLPAPPPAHVT